MQFCKLYYVNLFNQQQYSYVIHYYLCSYKYYFHLQISGTMSDAEFIRNNKNFYRILDRMFRMLREGKDAKYYKLNLKLSLQAKFYDKRASHIYTYKEIVCILEHTTKFFLL